MTEREKRKRAAIIAVAYYLEEEKTRQNEVMETSRWVSTAQEVAMGNRAMVQRRGRFLSSGI